MNDYKLFEETNKTKYFINREGQMYSEHLKKDKTLIRKDKKFSINKTRGYAYVRTVKKKYIVHRLVANLFINNPFKKPCVNHKDFNRLNNNYTNLEWVTFKENIHYSIKANRFNFLKKNQSYRLKYSNEQCLEVINAVKSGLTYVEAGKLQKMPYSTVAHLIRKSRRDIC